MSNGWDECRSCAHRNTGICDFCEDADQWEEGDYVEDDEEYEDEGFGLRLAA